MGFSLQDLQSGLSSVGQFVQTGTEALKTIEGFGKTPATATPVPAPQPQTTSQPQGPAPATAGIPPVLWIAGGAVLLLLLLRR